MAAVSHGMSGPRTHYFEWIDLGVKSRPRNLFKLNRNASKLQACRVRPCNTPVNLIHIFIMSYITHTVTIHVQTQLASDSIDFPIDSSATFSPPKLFTLSPNPPTVFLLPDSHLLRLLPGSASREREKRYFHTDLLACWCSRVQGCCQDFCLLRDFFWWWWLSSSCEISKPKRRRVCRVC